MPTINCITYLCGCRVELNLEDDAYLQRGADVQFGTCPRHGPGSHVLHSVTVNVPRWPVLEPWMPAYARLR